MWKEGFEEVDVGEVVGGEFGVDVVEVDAGGLGEIETALDAGVQQDTVEVWMDFCDSVDLLVIVLAFVS